MTMRSQRTLITILLSVTIALPAVSQNWCPPGAEWHWSIFNLGLDGYVHRWYSGDTVVGGRNAQEIRETGVIINYFANDTTALDETRFTAFENQDVLLWSENNGMWQWDTLYRFGALPGTIWRPANGFYGQGFCLVQVTDTSTTNYYGQPLRQLSLAYLEPDSTPSSFGTIVTERIGAEYGSWLLAYQCVMDAEVELLRCYSDVDMSYVDPNWNYGCASVMGIARFDATTGHFLCPNPGTDELRVAGMKAPSLVRMLDATGRVCMVVRSPLNGEPISTTALASGAYTVQVTDPDGSMQNIRWVKQ